jgi:hypothetical protein
LGGVPTCGHFEICIKRQMNIFFYYLTYLGQIRPTLWPHHNY